MIGGAFPFKNSTTFSILAKIGDETYDRINERRSKLVLPLTDLHMTFLSIFVNKNHPRCEDILSNTPLHDNIKKLFKKYIIDRNVKLKSYDPTKGGVWEFLGQPKSKFWTRVYDTDEDGDLINVAKFRLKVYGLLNDIFPELTRKQLNLGKGTDKEDFMVYSTDPKNPNKTQLYAINMKYWFGIKTWKPRISVFTKKELQPGIHDKLISIMDDVDISDDAKSSEIITLIGAVSAISNLVAPRDFKELRITHGYGSEAIQIDLPL